MTRKKLKGPILLLLPPTHENSEPNQSKEEMTENTEVPKGWTHEDMISQGG